MVSEPQSLAFFDRLKVSDKKKVIYQDLPVDDPKQRCPDISKARELLGWEPKVGREEGLKLTYAYFRSLTSEDLNEKEHIDFENYIH